MRFTAAQYDEAIANLQLARTQLEPDGHCCAVCGDSGHTAYECGHNPLLAQHYCVRLTTEVRQLHEIMHAIAGEAVEGPPPEGAWAALHETLHGLAGYDWWLGERVGPARIVVPAGGAEEPTP